jgi:rhamnosyltransferase
MGERSEGIDISIILPVKNEGKGIDKCLASIFSQRTSYSYEVIVIDSGSKDNTLDIAEKYPIKLERIKPEEFGHGKTRNFGASLARGEFLVYLTGDAIPANESWLVNLILNFNEDSVAGVYSRQIPKPDCNPLTLREIYQGFTPIKEVRSIEGLEREDYLRNLKRLTYFSNVSSAIRKRVWDEIPLNDKTIYAEDQEWARRVLEAGYTIVYEPKSTVYHSHNDSLWKTLKKVYDGSIFWKQTIGYGLNPLYHLGVILINTMEDWVFILRTRKNILFKFQWMTYSALLNVLGQITVVIGYFRPRQFKSKKWIYQKC